MVHIYKFLSNACITVQGVRQGATAKITFSTSGCFEDVITTALYALHLLAYPEVIRIL